MQSLNLTSLTDNTLHDLAHKTLEMKQVSIYNIIRALTKLRAYPNNFWSSVKVKTFSIMGTLVSALGILALAIDFYCKCFWNKMSCVHKHTRHSTLPNNDKHNELQPIINHMPEISDQLSPQLVQEILKASGVDMSKFEHYKNPKLYVRHSLSLLSCQKFKGVPLWFIAS